MVEPLIETQDTTHRKKLETNPEGKEERVTLAMVGGAENAARRPCFMGGLL